MTDSGASYSAATERCMMNDSELHVMVVMETVEKSKIQGILKKKKTTKRLTEGKEETPSEQ